LREHDLVVLTQDIPATGLKTGDVGVVVGVHDAGGYEVEFVSAAGETLGLLTLTSADVRPMTGAEILHVRDLASIRS
jgi:hypothetical protein